MNTNTHQLRLNAYSVTADDGKILCNHEGRGADERTAVLRIALAEDSKAGRDIVERLLTLVDEPRALLGRARNGAVLLFKCGERSPVPYIQGADRRDGVFELATRDAVRFTIECRSAGATVDVTGYDWPKGRSPLEIYRDRLPVLTSDIGEAVVREAFKFATWASIVEDERASAARFAQFHADVESGKVKILTDAEREAAADEKLVADHEGVEYHQYDGNMAALVLAARRRVSRRKADAEAARLAARSRDEIQAEDDARIVERHVNSKLPEYSTDEYILRIIQARARHAARQKQQAAA